MVKAILAILGFLDDALIDRTVLQENTNAKLLCTILLTLVLEDGEHLIFSVWPISKHLVSDEFLFIDVIAGDDVTVSDEHRILVQ